MDYPQQIKQPQNYEQDDQGDIDSSSNDEDYISEDFDYYFDNDTDEDEQEQNQNKTINGQNRVTLEKLKEMEKNIKNQVQITGQDKKYVNPIKVLVSKQKNRYEQDGFNLDLSYITHNIIAMGFPAENIESVYRNSMKEVVRFFSTKYANHYRIYNLCSEKNREYDKSQFQGGNVARFPFDDHQAPSFRLIYKFCLDMDEWLKKHESNIAGIHCKAGKGRTGVMICCYLLWSGVINNAEDSLQFYARMRTKNEKGVTIPSQIRYVLYFQIALQNKWDLKNFPNVELEITKIKLLTVPQFNMFGGCEPDFRITVRNQSNNDESENKALVYTYSNTIQLKQYKSGASIEFNNINQKVNGDVFIEFFNAGTLKKEKMFSIWFNCAFFEHNGKMVVDKSMLDKACKDKKNKKFSKDFHIEIYARRPEQIEKTQLYQKQLFKQPSDDGFQI